MIDLPFYLDVDNHRKLNLSVQTIKFTATLVKNLYANKILFNVMIIK